MSSSQALYPRQSFSPFLLLTGCVRGPCKQRGYFGGIVQPFSVRTDPALAAEPRRPGLRRPASRASERCSVLSRGIVPNDWDAWPIGSGYRVVLLTLLVGNWSFLCISTARADTDLRMSLLPLTQAGYQAALNPYAYDSVHAYNMRLAAQYQSAALATAHCLPYSAWVPPSSNFSFFAHAAY